MSDYKLEKELVDSAPYLIANYKDAQEFIEEARANGELVGSEWRGKLSNENERKKLFEKFARDRF